MNEHEFKERVFKFEDWIMDCLLVEKDDEKRKIYRTILKTAIDLLE